MIISIDYDDPGKDAPGSAVAASYRGVVTSEPERRWYTGDPVADWRTATMECASSYSYVMLSSSCDHFVSDCRGIFGWIEDPQLGDMIVRHTPEETAAIDAAIEQEDARIDAGTD